MAGNSRDQTGAKAIYMQLGGSDPIGIAGPGGTGGTAGLPLTIQDATTARTAAATDNNKIIEFTSSSPVNYIIKPYAEVPLKVGSILYALQGGAGQVTFVANDNNTYAAWDPANSSTAYSYSAGDTEVLRYPGSPIAGGTEAKVRATQACVGKCYFEAKSNLSIGVDYFRLGLDSGSASPYTAYLGQNANTCGAHMNSGTNIYKYENGGGSVYFSPTAAGISSHVWCGVAVDVAAGKAWIQIDGIAGWLGGGDPVAGTSPSFTFTPGSTVYPAVGTNAYPGATLFGNFGATAFVMSVPSGYDAGIFTPGASGTVVFETPDTYKTRAQESIIAMKHVELDRWEAMGDLETEFTARSVLGNATATDGPPAMITATADLQALFRKSGVLAWSLIGQSDVTNLVADLALKAPLASPTFTGVPAAPTAAPGTNTTQIATTAFVQAASTALVIDSIADADTTHAPSRNAVFDALALKAPLASPALTGVPTAPTAAVATNTTQLATTAFVVAEIAASGGAGLVIDSIADADTTHAPSRNAVFDALALKAPLASPTFTGVPAGPTASVGTNTTQLATTAFVVAEIAASGGVGVIDSIADADTTNAPSRNAVFDALALKAPLASPVLTGTPEAPTAGPGTNTTQIATTAFVITNISGLVTDAIVNGVVDVAPSQNAVFDALALKQDLIAAGTTAQFRRGDNTWSNALIGSLGIGAAPTAYRVLDISRPITGDATASSAIYVGSEIQSDVTGNAYGLRVRLGVAAFGIPTNVFHVSAESSGLAPFAGMNDQAGFVADSSLIDATNNYGFLGNIAAGTGRWNFYGAGTANNYMAGSLGIGNNSLTGYSLRVAKTITGNISSFGVHSNGVIQSDVTSAAYYNRTVAATQATAFTCVSLFHYQATQGTIGAGSAVTSQYGFSVDNTLTGAATNYGFHSNIAAGTNRWNFYAAGSANNYMDGALGIGSTSLTGFSLRIGKTMTGAPSSRHVFVNGTIQSDVITEAVIFETACTTQATNFTLATMRHYFAALGTQGATSIITTQQGFVTESTLSNGTFNYMFVGNLPVEPGSPTTFTAATITNLEVVSNVVTITTSVAHNFTVGQFVTLAPVTNFLCRRSSIAIASTPTSTTFTVAITTANVTSMAETGSVTPTRRWNLYMAGTANNYIEGSISVGSTTVDASAKLAVTSTTKGFLPPRVTTTQKNNITSPTAGLVVYDSTTGRLNYRGAAAWVELQAAGAPSPPTVRNVTATYSETTTTGDVYVFADATSGAITVNLPTAVGNAATIVIKRMNSGANAVTIDGATTETIDGALTAVLNSQYESITLVSNNTNWGII